MFQLNETAPESSVESTVALLLESKNDLPVVWTADVDEPILHPLLRMAYDLVRAENAMYVLYIDVGNLPKQRAEQYVKEVMTNYRNKEGQGNLAYFIPVRNTPTRIEVMYKSFTVDRVLEVLKQLQNA